MDYKELMCGDWVKVEQTTEVVKAKVLGVYKDGINYEVDYSGVRATNQIHTDYVSPIKLTEDILVKNGFEYAYNKASEMQNKQLLVANISGHYIEVRLDKKNVAIWYDYDENESDFYSDVFLPLPYFVHGFQHLLRLCGIEKSIIV